MPWCSKRFFDFRWKVTQLPCSAEYVIKLEKFWNDGEYSPYQYTANYPRNKLSKRTNSSEASGLRIIDDWRWAFVIDGGVSINNLENDFGHRKCTDMYTCKICVPRCKFLRYCVYTSSWYDKLSYELESALEIF